MSDNIYQPPQSEVDISQESHQPFYVVSKQKFWILFAATFGIYSLYWFYQHWRQYKRFTGTSIWPVPRAIFSVFFAHSLFRSIRNMADEQGYPPPISPGLLATIYVVFSLLSNGADRAAARDIGSPFSDVVSFFTIWVVGSVLYQVQKAANAASKDPGGETNSVLTAANIIWIVLGVIFWILMLIGIYTIITYTGFE